MGEITLDEESLASARSQRERLERMAASVGLTPDLDQMRPTLVLMLLIVARQQDAQSGVADDMQPLPEDPQRRAQLAATLGVRYDGEDDSDLYCALMMIGRFQDAARGRTLPPNQLQEMREFVSSLPPRLQDEMREGLLRELGIDLVSNHGRSLA